MSLKIGIVGLPNVGKSTLFNALTKTKGAEAQNYPFCTIDPNVGIVEVPDERLKMLGEVSHSEKIIPAAVEFVDIAGLVKGASEGEGLGNQFLANIRECQAIGHVIRGFVDSNVIHVHGEVSPKFDREIIESELLLADIQTVEKRLAKATSEAKSGGKEKIAQAALLERVLKEMQSGKLASTFDLTEEERKSLADLHLLTFKPNLYIINIAEEELTADVKAKYAELLDVEEDKIVPVSAKVEEELINFNTEEAAEYLNSLGVQESGLNALIKAAYSTLGLITYFTSGPKETRAWTITRGTSAPQAAGVIHSDFEDGFIKAEVFNWKEFAEAGGEARAKEKGLMRIEGKDYVVKDGDVMHFRFSS